MYLLYEAKFDIFYKQITDKTSRLESAKIPTLLATTTWHQSVYDIYAPFKEEVIYCLAKSVCQ